MTLTRPWPQRFVWVALAVLLWGGSLPLLNHVRHAAEAALRGELCGVAPLAVDARDVPQAPAPADAGGSDCCVPGALPDGAPLPSLRGWAPGLRDHEPPQRPLRLAATPERSWYRQPARAPPSRV